MGKNTIFIIFSRKYVLLIIAENIFIKIHVAVIFITFVIHAIESA